MNKGWIEVDAYGQFIVVEMNEFLYETEYPLHPHFKNKQFQVGELVDFQLAMECSRHYPFVCDCLKMTTFALPVLSKKKSIFERIKKMFK